MSEKEKLLLVAWVVFSAKLHEHIQNGVARGLYPQAVADKVFEHLGAINKELIA
jgi:hypothetical protein